MIHERVQRLIYSLESGLLSRWFKILPVILGVVLLVVVYDLRAYRGFASPGAMDTAQVARHLAAGQGFTTDFVRPFSLYLLQKHNQATNPVAADPMWLNGAPDLANAPVYPVVLAGLMKTWKPEVWNISTNQSFWADKGRFQRYKPEFYIAFLNQALLLIVVVLTFFLANKLLDERAAWLAAVLTLSSDLLWKFSVSGLSTMLLLVVFMGLVWCLVKYEEAARAEKPSLKRLLLLAAAAGLLTGLGMMTRYAFGMVLLPVALFLAFFGGPRRWWPTAAAVVVFALAIAPWIVRNCLLCGAPFGTAGFALAEAADSTRLMQSIQPVVEYSGLPAKFFHGLNTIVQNDLFPAGSFWVSALFFTGLLLGLRQPGPRRLRYFALACLVTLLATQALGTTGLATLAQTVNAQNLLVLLTPLLAIFGSAFFLTLLDQMKLPFRILRYGVAAAVVALAVHPLAASLAARPQPLAYPPYYPPEIQQVAGWMKPGELLMSDMPWAVAWYGRRPSLWLTANAQSDFFTVNDYVKPVSGLLLTYITLNQPFLSDILRDEPDGWGRFVYSVGIQNKFPAGFPLPRVTTISSGGMFFSDRDRWTTPR